ncbi:iron-regulated protein frpC [Roseobacter denitrificans]|uniref:Iron-regulated protein frpC, putative n=1 Tax=Roseobacter denitrificans (strain ATCC 33942 / OCh 114) TaxID=375451 RepID=Q160Z5_ROSDO|nr:calcium-binding protein [Roseobacter denitrificans]ABG33448.1 iron-regulated protein frpC, putative [Roseobacter denitrificans OCh 114]AVL52766.1 iron-regulated protein frpC [Roseobacter denitrificans]SFG49508.1 Hemolysin-type calcium-binding repeat-containing protein [Roseobacter denitrificans OCh 114]
MSIFNLFNLFSNGLDIKGSNKSDLIIGSFGNDKIAGNGGDDLMFGLFGNDKMSGGLGDDRIFAGAGRDIVEGGEGEDALYGNNGNDVIVGNRGNDKMFGGSGNDKLVWNNGDGSDLMNGGSGYDKVQVNFDTDLVDDDLQNKDVAEFETTETGVQFARTEVNDQSERGLFQLDIRETEVLETNFGGGDDTAVIKGDVLEKIALDLDGGDGIDTLDLSQVDSGIKVDLAAGKLAHSKAENFENVIGTEYQDLLRGDAQDNVISGLGGDDQLGGRAGNDTLIGNKGNDKVFGGDGDDLLIWNNGDGSDLMHGGNGYDRLQVNFDTDLVNDDLQNKDVAEFSVADIGLQFARTEVNDQSEAGLFQLDVRNIEVLETNFGGGDDAAVIKDNILKRIELELDGGDGVDLLDLSDAASAVTVDLAAGTITDGANTSTAINFENVTGTDFNDTIIGNDQDNVIRGGAGNDVMSGGAGADTFVFFEEDAGVDIILDFEIGVDSLLFLTNDPEVTTDSLLSNLTQTGDDVELAFNNKVITFEDTVVSDFNADDFMIV